MSHFKPRISALLALVSAVAAGAVLFSTSQRVQTAEAEKRRLLEALNSEKQTIRVLSAEWDYLSSPDRIEALSREYLKMIPPQPGAITPSAASLPDTTAPIVPKRKPGLVDDGAQPVSLDAGDLPALTPASGGGQEGAPR